MVNDKLITTALDEPKFNQISLSLSNIKTKRPKGDKAGITADSRTTIDTNTTGAINNDSNIENGYNYFSTYNKAVTKNGTNLHNSTEKEINILI